MPRELSGDEPPRFGRCICRPHPTRDRAVRRHLLRIRSGRSPGTTWALAAAASCSSRPALSSGENRRLRRRRRSRETERWRIAAVSNSARRARIGTGRRRAIASQTRKRRYECDRRSSSPWRCAAPMPLRRSSSPGRICLLLPLEMGAVLRCGPNSATRGGMAGQRLSRGRHDRRRGRGERSSRCTEAWATELIGAPAPPAPGNIPLRSHAVNGNAAARPAAVAGSGRWDSCWAVFRRGGVLACLPRASPVRGRGDTRTAARSSNRLRCVATPIGYLSLPANSRR